MKLSGWGRFPVIDSEVAYPQDHAQMIDCLQQDSAVIARGLGRSYGDSALAPKVMQTRHLDNYLGFDADSGTLHCAAGVSLDDIIRTFLPRGWFLPVTPGTRFVTVGGAIASDVHGKNHHLHGSFSDHVDKIELMLGNGDIVTTSRQSLPELFHATCGGMGLTGIICSAWVRLKAVPGATIRTTTIKAPDLDAILQAFADNDSASYSVAWIDCLAKGKSMGRSLLMLGEHEAGQAQDLSRASRKLPLPLLSPLLNRHSAAAFNAVYYGKASATAVKKTKLIDFFYPLDMIANWNHIYGDKGFVQYQCVLPKTTDLERLLQTIGKAGLGSFLGVLKKFGNGNGNLLSFPMPGYTLALDFMATEATLQLLQGLDELVLAAGGRVYLAKDARMRMETFRACYPKWQDFENIRAKYNAIGKFASAQSRRLGLQ